jgi:hypothetical protein
MTTSDKKWTRNGLTALFVGATLVGCGGPAPGAAGPEATAPSALRGHGDEGNEGSVSSRLGGRAGILAFLETLVVPAELADPEIAPFFTQLTESADDIEQCLANLLDHDLGGESPHFGAVLADGHQCRSSMSEIHRGRAIPDRIVDKFIVIVGQQATIAGVAPADIQAVADVLDRYRGGTRNK